MNYKRHSVDFHLYLSFDKSITLLDLIILIMNYPHNKRNDNINNPQRFNTMAPRFDSGVSSAPDFHVGRSNSSYTGQGRGAGALSNTSYYSSLANNLNSSSDPRTINVGNDGNCFNTNGFEYSNVKTVHQVHDQLFQGQQFISPEVSRGMRMAKDGSFQQSVPNTFGLSSMPMAYHQGESSQDWSGSAVLFNNSGRQRQFNSLATNFNTMQQQSFFTPAQEDYYSSQYGRNPAALINIAQVTPDRKVDFHKHSYSYPPFSTHLTYKEGSKNVGKLNRPISKEAHDSDSEGEEGEKQHVENPTVICRCMKSRCLKLYCDCFQAEKLCNTQCKCVRCLNTEAENDKGGRLKAAKRDYLLRKPQSFGKKRKKIGEGCACKNNRCLKKYCDCFRTEISCSDNCCCVSCENVGMQKRRHVEDDI
jgi:hypothetical protein